MVIEVTHRPLDPQAVIELVRDPSCGAIVAFIGTVREVSHGREVIQLEYQAYREMAEAKLGEICGDIAARWKTERTAIVHRVGPLSLGEISVVIAVAHPHRQPAFEAAQFAIDRIKEIVPIWKKEHWRNGAGWV